MIGRRIDVSFGDRWHLYYGWEESALALTLARSVSPSSRPRRHALARPQMLLDGNTLGRAPTRNVEGFALVDLRADLVGASSLPTPRAHTLELVDALDARAQPATLHTRALIDI